MPHSSSPAALTRKGDTSVASDTLVAAEALRRYTQNVLEVLGLPPGDATIVAESLVQADLRGVHSHGVLRIPTYVRALQHGQIDARPHVEVVQEHGGQAVIDGGRAMGQVAAQRAIDHAMALCEQHGIGAVAVRNSNHCGAMAFWAVQGLARQMIGLATTNAGINMPPTGGRTKLVGNNPVAIAIPTTRSWPMVLDMATSVAAGGKLDVAASKGVPIPEGWALDAGGRPTTDPVAGRKGALLPVGGPKGYGLAVMLDVFAGVLSGGRFGAGLGGAGSSHFFLLLDIARFQNVADFLAHMDELIDQLHACPPAEGSERVFVPGEIEHALETQRLRAGIPIEQTVIEQLDAVAINCGVATVER